MNKNQGWVMVLGCVVGTGMGCGQVHNTNNLATLPSTDGVIVRSRATFNIQMGDTPKLSLQQRIFNFFMLSPAFASTADSTIAINVTNAASSSITLDNSLFVIPTVSNALLDFKFLQLTALSDNNLDLCGTNSNQHCNTALIRMYTTGTTAAGLYNTIDAFGAPITAGQTTLTPVGLGAANANVLQTITVASTKHVNKLVDFVSPKYDVQVDFTNAGAGSYSTTVVVEYALSP